LAFIWQSIPDPEVLLSLSPEEVGQHLISHIAALPEQKAHPSMFETGLIGDRMYPDSYRVSIPGAVLEAWAWLQAEGHLVLTSGSSNGWVRLSRRAQTLTDPVAFAKYRATRLLPKELLHKDIRERVWLNVMRGDFETAVFEAMRRVEINVREASDVEDLGVKLMRAAFHPDTGPLRDINAEFAEREARMHLFSGAIGSYKNPISHRHVPLGDAGEVVEQIMLASHLLRIVDARLAALKTG
jgi:uncharacterized protein (TIGR02391 family)